MSVHASAPDAVARRRKLRNRLSYIRGHAAAVAKMIEDGAYCPEIILQNLAIIRAIQRVNELVLEEHLRTCVRAAMRGDDERAHARVEREILDILRHAA
ncbi:metal-sensing transcriptional repressor [Candidatus Uhrbacteria bacterium]|nr:metal-sensing transcriptional repressor [Candidatus Uhrbacteria bacterium]